MPFKLLDAMLALGGNVEPIKVMRSGSNAVDMHIAYYVGRLVEKEPAAEIHIISGDTDFDPLVEYLKAHGVKCKRAKSITEIAKLAQRQGTSARDSAAREDRDAGGAQAAAPTSSRPSSSSCIRSPANPRRARNSRRPSANVFPASWRRARATRSSSRSSKS